MTYTQYCSTDLYGNSAREQCKAYTHPRHIDCDRYTTDTIHHRIEPYRYTSSHSTTDGSSCTSSIGSLSQTTYKSGVYDSDRLQKIEVSPGIFLPLMGSKETWDSIKYDSYMPCICHGCSSSTTTPTTLFCSNNVSFVVCCQCFTISPTITQHDVSLYDDTTTPNEAMVGMGFTFDNLCEWQERK